MNALLVGDDPFLARLRAQLQVAEVKSRDLTGSGFYIEFAIPRSAPRVDPPRFKLGDVLFEVDGLEHGGGAILHGEGGELGTLEAYSNASTWPAETKRFQISYFGGERDLVGLMDEIHRRK